MLSRRDPLRFRQLAASLSLAGMLVPVLACEKSIERMPAVDVPGLSKEQLASVNRVLVEPPSGASIILSRSGSDWKMSAPLGCTLAAAHADALLSAFRTSPGASDALPERAQRAEARARGFTVTALSGAQELSRAEVGLEPALGRRQGLKFSLAAELRATLSMAPTAWCNEPVEPKRDAGFPPFDGQFLDVDPEPWLARIVAQFSSSSEAGMCPSLPEVASAERAREFERCKAENLSLIHI